MNPKRRYFNELAANWDRIPAPPDAPAKTLRFLESAAVIAARRILDVGCGTGILVPHILATHPAADCVVELDVAESMLQQNAAKFPRSPVAHVCSDARDLPFADGCFDLVLCFNAVPHLGEPSAALRQLLRVLRPGGVFAVGHLSGSDELNGFHRSLGGPVGADTLIPARDLAVLLSGLGAAPRCTEEAPDWYFVRAEKAFS